MKLLKVVFIQVTLTLADVSVFRPVQTGASPMRVGSRSDKIQGGVSG